MTIAPDDIPKALADLGSADHLSEVVVLSTCNRVEIYAYAEKFHGGYQDIREFFGRHAGLAPEDVNDHLYALHDTEAIRHLFSVTAGLDSAVIGEHEILGQVRTAWERSAEHGTVGSTLGPLFRHAVETGKRPAPIPRSDVASRRSARLPSPSPPSNSAASTVAPCSYSVPARWPREPSSRSLRPAPPTSSSPTALGTTPWRSPRRAVAPP